MRDVEASSDAEAIAMFDASQYTASIVVSSAHGERDRARVERMRHEFPDERTRSMKLLMSLVMMIAAAIVGCGLSVYLRSDSKPKSGDWNRSESSDAEKALGIKVLLDD